jgi:hypothetical protein
VGDVLALNGPTVGMLLADVTEAHENGALLELLIVGRDGQGSPVVGISSMTSERALWLADHLLQYARSISIPQRRIT